MQNREYLYFDEFVKSGQRAACHSERSEESNHINVIQILHFVQDDKSGLCTRPLYFGYFITPHHPRIPKGRGTLRIFENIRLIKSVIMILAMALFRIVTPNFFIRRKRRTALVIRNPTK